MKNKLIFIIVLVVIIVCTIVMLVHNDENSTIMNIFKKPKNVIVTASSLEIKRNIKEAKVPIFMYHNITDDLSYIEFSENAVSPIQFEKQLQEINNNNYQSIFISDIDKLFNYTKPIALTFDDGFEDFYTNAFPLLKKYNVKATLFVIVGYINCTPYCKLEQLKEMQESGLVQIESHTRTHVNLAYASAEQKEEEIINSTNLLNEYLNKTDNSVFCYPYGAYDKETIELLKQKYDYAVIMGDSLYKYNVDNKYIIPRITMYRSTNIHEFKKYLSSTKVVLE